MASASPMSDETSSPSNSESESERESDAESDSADDSETVESLSSFDQSEEEDHLSSEDIIKEEPASGPLPCEFEIDKEKPSDVEATEESSYDLERSGLTESKKVLRTLSLLIWNTLSKSRMVSLLKDFVESEFFLIDGDSLFITCVSNVNFKKGQTLHFFYIVEQFLHDFIQKEAKFIIVFFKDAENLYSNCPELLALRTILIQHLEYNTDVTIHTEFSNCLTPEWEIFLKECYPCFLIVTEKGIIPRQTDFLNIFIIHALQKKINIVQCSGIESDALRIYGYYASSCYSHKQFFEKNEIPLQHALYAYIVEYYQKSQEREIFLYGHLRLNLGEMQKEIHQALSLLHSPGPEGADVRSVVCSVSCAVTLKLYTEMLHGAQDLESPTTSTEEQNTQDLKKTPTLNEAADLCRMHCLSVICLQHLPLFQRAKSRIITSAWDKTLLPILRMLKYCEFFTLKQLKARNNWNVNYTGLPDLTDNNLCKNIAYYYEVEYSRGLTLELGDTLKQSYQTLWNMVLTVSGDGDFGGPMPVRTTSRPFLTHKETSPRGSKQEIHKLGLIPLKAEIIEDYAGDILSELPFLSSDDPAIASLSEKKECDELMHWHSFRPLSDDFEKMMCSTKSKDARERKDIQKLQCFYHLFGKSMIGSNRSVRVIRGRELPPPGNSSVQKKKKHQKTSAEKIIEENQKRQLAKLEKKQEERWNNLSDYIEKEIKENPNSGIKRLEDFIQGCPIKSVKFAAEMVGLDACFKLWVEHCSKPETVSRDINIIINLMKRIHIIHEKHSELLQNVHRQKIAKYLKYIGFDNLAHLLCPQVQESSSEKDTSKYSVHMGAARFQLTYMSPYLFREERSDPDPRVHHFIPDTWQRELLDVVDNNESAVIVAPTSSGKTYASYYCMEKILRQSDDGVVVYVAPTKALVNQVVGTVYSLFTKALPKGLTVCGVFTRDYRHDTFNCQILVTVPQCLEILLLSPRSHKWVKRIRYVIFDEVHCLGGEIGAEVWEHLLVMIRCPFLALSATISNPEHLTEWLVLIKRYWQHVESTMENSGSLQDASKVARKQQRKGVEKPSYRVRLVWYKERYNDLEKYVCSLKDNDFIIEHYHPCAALTVKHLEKYGIPLDLGFSPRESILLYDAMVHVWPEWTRMQELEPEEFSCFKNKIVIMRTDAKKYEEELKKEMIRWVQLDPSKVNQLLKYLKPQTFDCAETEKRRMFPHFVEKLKEMNKLPAIFFSFNIHSVELSASRLLTNSIIKRNTDKDPNSEREKNNLNKKLQKVVKSQKRNCAAFFNSDSGSRIQRIIVLGAEIKEMKKNLKKYYAVTPDCTYADHTVVDNQTLSKILYRLRGTRKSYKLHGLLRRGIGYHHGSMEYKQRQVVEMLFRLKHVKVITATSTLALGINMPCKSVVFMEDSVFLDALNFRQMSGRAGRRGEDLTGNVFFYDIPLPKIERLLKSNVPKLKGQFPLSISLVLRLMLLVAKADDKEDAKAKALSVLQHSLMSFKQPKMKCMLKFYFIYSLQFLIREEYLNQECIPIGYSSLVSHLHYHEPANFVLVSLLKKGIFHKLCTPTNINGQKRFSEDVMETLVVVLANLFGRRHLPPCVNKLKKNTSRSMVILDDLPREFAEVVKEHNSIIQKNFGSFLLTISKLADMTKESQLPLSEIDFSGEECEDSELVSHLMPGTEHRTAVSPFACLSNITDQDLFRISVVKDAMFQTIYVDVTKVPFFYMTKYDINGRKSPLNGYVMNFYKNRSLSALTWDNWLNMGDAYHLLKDFALTVRAIRISLSELCDDEDDNVVLAFKQLSKAFIQILGKKD
ncbi:probable ATP-dependent RNA helicase DDX60 isoform X1 [Artibeus jamaicensis]|uniref:probable ATP-dependent RNA helicase DDX60 isoform X1 n=1 Tax=Artibeus jamaicensis TaxID=9417 RepID=UPI00235B0689|nr:probable ATP-dependent RNA helicase DDX60 isoform X1 [Artibeus jamaicensis]XP_053514627.1 probable ATP-dependent RNA helicase DDX60 isoform X1 [Artibeus jamaicensis]